MEENQNENTLEKYGGFTSDQRERKDFLQAIHIYKEKEQMRRGHVEFIYVAMKNMEAFGVHKDLEVC